MKVAVIIIAKAVTPTKHMDNDKENQINGHQTESGLNDEDDKSLVSSASGQLVTTLDSDGQLLYERRVIRLRCQLCPQNEELLRTTTNAFAYHRLGTAAELVSHLSMDRRVPHSYLSKALLILFKDKPTDITLATDLFKSLHSYDINKRELLLDILLIVIQNHSRIEAKKFIELHEEIVHSKRNRKHPIIDAYLKAYICLVDYLLWKDRTTDSYSDRLLTDKIKLSLRNVIDDNKDMILDNFVSILIELYENDDQLKDVFNVLNTYIDNNPNHLNAYIYLYKMSVKYPDQSDTDLKVKALKKIASISPENPLVLDLVRNDWVSNEEKFKILMEYIDHKQNHNDTDTWLLIQEFLGSIEQKYDLKIIKDLWKQFYESYWVRLHCNLNRIKPKDFDQNVIEIIECKQKIIEFFYSSSHPFVIETTQMIDNFRVF